MVEGWSGAVGDVVGVGFSFFLQRLVSAVVFSVPLGQRSHSPKWIKIVISCNCYVVLNTS